MQSGTHWAHQIGFTLRHISAKKDAGAAPGLEKPITPEAEQSHPEGASKETLPITGAVAALPHQILACSCAESHAHSALMLSIRQARGLVYLMSGVS